MLPSRLFRNTGLPPPLRSLIIPHSSLPTSIAVQLRLRLGVVPATVKSYSKTARRRAIGNTDRSTTVHPLATPPPPSSSSFNAQNTTATTTSQSIPETLEPKLQITFTCTVPDCNERSTHQFTKRAYERGIVLVQCPGCKTRHLIADHLGWFKESTEDGKLRTVEDLMKAKGEKVRRGSVNSDGVMDLEYAE